MTREIARRQDSIPMIHVGPVVYENLRNQKAVIYFEDDFEPDAIRHLINDIERVRQIRGYSQIDLYFNSRGGYAKELGSIVRYLNKIDDIRINFIANGPCCSCGFYILLLLENPNIAISILNDAYAMIHLSTIQLDGRNLLGNDLTPSNFHKKSLEKSNEEWLEMLSHCKLTREEMDIVKSGEDLYVDSDRLYDIIKNYDFWRKCDTGELDASVEHINQQIEELRKRKMNIKKGYKEYFGKDYIEPKDRAKKAAKDKQQAAEK